MARKIIYLPNGGKVTTEDMSVEEFVKLYPDAFRIGSEDDVRCLAEMLGVNYEEIKKQQTRTGVAHG